MAAVWGQAAAGPVRISGKACCRLTPLHLEFQAVFRQKTALMVLPASGMLFDGVQGQALVFNAGAEIGVGFLLLVGLVTPQRSLLLAFVYWKNFLPTRYHTPDAAGYHRQAHLSYSLGSGGQAFG